MQAAGTYVQLHVHLVPAISVFLPEASSEVCDQLPDEREEGVVVGILGDLQVAIHEGAEVAGEELGEDVVGEELLQVQAVLQKEADKFGPVLDESREHDFLKVRGLRRKQKAHSPLPSKREDAGERPTSATSFFQLQSKKNSRSLSTRH